MPSGGGKEPQKALAVAVLAADDLLLPLVPVVEAEKLVEDRLHVAEQRLRRSLAFLRHGAIGVPAADDVTDAVFMAVDGEFVARGQGPALCADLGKLRFVGEGNARRRAQRRCAAKRIPARAVDVVKSVGRIDEAVPQFVEGLEQPPLQVHSVGNCLQADVFFVHQS